MITINLLPTEFRRKIEQPHVVSLRFGMIIVCLIVGILWGSFGYMVGTATREKDNMSGDWKRLEAGAKEADKIMLDINQNYLERKKTCDLILASEMSWAYVLNQISDLIPDSAWLRKIKLSSAGMNEWEFWMKGIEKAPEDEPAIKSIGRYVSAIKPALEQEQLRDAKSSADAAGGTKEINVQTSTAQEIINNNALTSFEAIFTMKGKPDEGVRDKHKSA